jgi:hypothetical protein
LEEMQQIWEGQYKWFRSSWPEFELDVQIEKMVGENQFEKVNKWSPHG